jgi:hypothetical protein
MGKYTHGQTAYVKTNQNRTEVVTEICDLTYVPGHGIPFARALDYGK